MFKNTKSKKLEKHTRKSFSNISAKSVTDLTSRTKGKIEKQRLKKAEAKSAYENTTYATTDEMQVDENKFHQIVKIDLGVKSKENVLACVKKLEARDDVLMACPNYYFKPTGEVIPNDTCFPADYKYGGQWGSRLIDLPKAWDITTGSSTVKVGVLDSGIESTHPDLKNRYNSSLSKDFTGGNSPNTDITGHGTQVAGIIGAQGNNSRGVAGVCWNVSLVSLKVTKYNSAGEYNADLGLVGDAIDYAMDKNIPILNFSYCGENEHYDDLEIIWQNYPGLFVCSTTNEKEDVTNDTFAHQEYNSKNTIVVTATNKDDELLEFTNAKGEHKGASYSATKVHLAAPGYDIWTTSIGNDYVCTYGTSMATPYVAGVAALLKSEYPDMKTQAIKYYILGGVDKLEDKLGGKVSTEGRLNAYKTLNNVTTFTVVYHPGEGGEGNMDSTEVIYYNRTPLSKNTYTRDGYTFKGWYAKRKSDEKWCYHNGTTYKWCSEGSQPAGYTKYLYVDGRTVIDTTPYDEDVVTMYAQWTPNYTIKFNGNNASSGTMADMNVVFGTPFNLTANAFSRGTDTMTHWYAKKGNLMYYTGASGSGWYTHGNQPSGYIRKEFTNKMYIGESSLTNIDGGDVITMNAYWQPNSGLLGDVNVDGNITIQDSTLIQNYLANEADLTAYQQKRADVNFSGSVTIKDSTMIQKYVGREITEFGS